MIKHLVAYLSSILIISNIACFNSQALGNPTNSIPVRVITADYTDSNGPTSMMFKQCVGAGRANEGLRADWQRQLTFVKQQCDFKYIRMHGLLDDDMGVYREDKNGHPIYNWQYIDELYDFLERIHVRPFVELGFMPNSLASGTQKIFWYQANVTPPKDYAKWHDLIKALLEHWTERYGKDEVKKWYFEVWNEPNLHGFWDGSQQDYFMLYSTTAAAVKEVCPSYRVGGPATAGEAWVPDLINFTVQNHSPLDFISTHTYGVNVGFLDENGSKGTVLSHNPESIYGGMRRVRSQIQASALPKLPLYYTEWSASYTPSDPIHDSYIEAPYILDKIKHATGVVDSMSYWTFTDIFEEAGPRATPFHGGFGLINYEDICKPAFYSYQFLNKLGNQELTDTDDDSLVTKDSNGNIAALFWDLTITQPTTVNNQAYYVKDLPSRLKSMVSIRLKNVPASRYKLSVYRIGYRINDAFDSYRDLGSPSQLTRAQVAYIRANNAGTPSSIETISVKAGQPISLMYPLRENDVYLITLKKIP